MQKVCLMIEGHRSGESWFEIQVKGQVKGQEFDHCRLCIAAQKHVIQIHKVKTSSIWKKIFQIIHDIFQHQNIESQISE